jgi:hypothetical protein
MEVAAISDGIGMGATVVVVHSSLRGAKRRSNPGVTKKGLDCFASLAMTEDGGIGQCLRPLE